MFTGIVLYYILKEFADAVGLKIKSVKKFQNSISIDFIGKSLSAHLEPRYSRITLEKIKGEGFYQSLFGGSIVEDISQIKLDRLLIIKLSGNLKIVFELFGRHSDCLFLKNDKVLYSFKGKKSGNYKIPEPPEGLNILTAERDELLSAILEGRSISGLSKNFIKRLKKEKKEIVENFVKREFKPTILNDIISPFSLGYGEEFPTMNEAVIKYFNFIKQKDSLEERKKEILKVFNRDIKKLNGALIELSSLENPENYRIKGEALLSNKGKVKKGMKEIKLEYLGKELIIPLDVKYKVEDNIKKYFKLYKKAKRKAGIAYKKKIKIKEEIEKLKKKKEEILQSKDLENLVDYFDKSKEKIERPSHGFREFVTSNGYKVLVGKDKESNHRLTFSYAKPYDIFLHVKNAPGPHTILKLKDKNKFPSPKDIEEAAIIAARFSKMKKANLVPVSYTERKYVKSSKKLPPGKVILEREKVIYIRLS